MNGYQVFIDNLMAVSSSIGKIKSISTESQLQRIIVNATNNDFTKDSESNYPYLKNKTCDLKLIENTNGTVFWVEVKDNITLLPVNTSKIIYEMNKLIFLDLARLIVGVNCKADYRLVVANIDKKLISSYYGINPNQVTRTSFFAEDILPASNNRKKFVEMKLGAKIDMHFLDYYSCYLLVVQILNGFVSISVYKNLENKKSEGEDKIKYYIEVNDNDKQKFFENYFPSS